MKDEKMNQPDEALIILWMDGELTGDELLQVEQWVGCHPELLAEREAVKSMRTAMRAKQSASVEPPYPEFFNQQVLRSIREDDVKEGAVAEKAVKQNSFWQWLAAPMAVAGMVACFFWGTQMKKDGVGSGGTVAIYSSVYTPDGEVKSDIFESEDHRSTVILLEGLKDIPDDVDIVSRSSQSHEAPYIAMLSHGAPF